MVARVCTILCVVGHYFLCSFSGQGATNRQCFHWPSAQGALIGTVEDILKLSARAALEPHPTRLAKESLWRQSSMMVVLWPCRLARLHNMLIAL